MVLKQRPWVESRSPFLVFWNLGKESRIKHPRNRLLKTPICNCNVTGSNPGFLVNLPEIKFKKNCYNCWISRVITFGRLTFCNCLKKMIHIPNTDSLQMRIRNIVHICHYPGCHACDTVPKGHISKWMGLAFNLVWMGRLMCTKRSWAWRCERVMRDRPRRTISSSNKSAISSGAVCFFKMIFPYSLFLY